MHRLIALSGIPLGFAFAEWGVVHGEVNSTGWVLIGVFVLLVLVDVILWVYARRTGKPYLRRD